MPVGNERAPLSVKKSPLTPATVSIAETLRSSWVSVSRGPVIVPAPSTGPIAVSPVGGGAVITE